VAPDIVLLGVTLLAAIGAVRVVLWGRLLVQKARWLPVTVAGLAILAAAWPESREGIVLLVLLALGLYLIWRVLRFIVENKGLAMLLIVTLALGCATLVTLMLGRGPDSAVHVR
jgi:hypothetical protein